MTHAVSLVLAPHFSALSVARYQQKVADGLELYRGRIHFEHVPSYHDAPGLVEAFAARVEEGLSRWPEDERDARPRRLQRAQPPRARARVGRSVRRPVPRDGAPRRAARAGCPTSAGRGRTSRRAGRPSRGPGRISASTWRRSPRKGVRDVVVGAGRLRLRPRRDPLRHRHRAAGVAAGLGMRLERPPALNDDPALHRSARRARPRARRAAGWTERHAPRDGVVVVGGGIAGLAAARRLESLAPETRRRARREGRRARREDPHRARRRLRVEAAPDSFLSRKERGVGLCEELGLGDELDRPPTRSTAAASCGAATSCTRSPRA